MISQKHTILKHLKTSSITKVQALRLYGIWNTGDCIMKLRRDYEIRTEMISRVDKAPYAKYSLVVA